MLRFFVRQSPTLAFVEALALLFAISWLDLATGRQVSLVLFYTAPIIFAVWLCDNKSVFVIAGLAGVLWSWADLALGHSYSSSTVQAAERCSAGWSASPPVPSPVAWAFTIRPPVLDKPAGQVGLPLPQLTVTSFNVVIVTPGIVGMGDTQVFTSWWLRELPGLLVATNPV